MFAARGIHTIHFSAKGEESILKTHSVAVPRAKRKATPRAKMAASKIESDSDEFDEYNDIRCTFDALLLRNGDNNCCASGANKDGKLGLPEIDTTRTPQEWVLSSP